MEMNYKANNAICMIFSNSGWSLASTEKCYLINNFSLSSAGTGKMAPNPVLSYFNFMWLTYECENLAVPCNYLYTASIVSSLHCTGGIFSK